MIETFEYCSPKSEFIFQRDEVLAVDLTRFLRFYHPCGQTPRQLREHFGSTAIGFEDVDEVGDLAPTPEGRRFLRNLHQAWPYAGFFLHLHHPFGPAHGLGAVPMLAYALCLVDVQLVESAAFTGLRANQDQLLVVCGELTMRMAELGAWAMIPVEVLMARQGDVAAQITSTFSVH